MLQQSTRSMTPEECQILGLSHQFIKSDMFLLGIAAVWALFLFSKFGSLHIHLSVTDKMCLALAAILLLLIIPQYRRILLLKGCYPINNKVELLSCRPEELLIVTVLNIHGWEEKRYYIFQLDANNLLAINRDECTYNLYGAEMPNCYFEIVRQNPQTTLAIHACGELMRPTRSIIVQDINWKPEFLCTPYQGKLNQYRNQYRTVA